jgi:hypothetical protein
MDAVRRSRTLTTAVEVLAVSVLVFWLPGVAEAQDAHVTGATMRLAEASAPAGQTPAAGSGGAQAAGQSSSGLAKASQNPIADLISLPFQNNMNFNVGPNNHVQNVLNIQPVIPINLNEDWNLITRTILPVMYQPELAPGVGNEFGIGDLQVTGWFSPAKSEGLVWGVGPVFRFPTATDDSLGSDQWSMGPTAVALVMTGPWVAGGLIQNVWSVGGDSDRPDVNELLIQPFVNYNLADGWYLVTAPLITANWEASGGDRWTVPIGGGVGRVFKIGKQPINCQVQAFYNLDKPKNAADWTLRLQVQLLFPKG